jgi:regulator of protease activity HflC (stomatin/prohibitin superfamily)
MNLLVVLIPAAVVVLLLVGSSARMVQQYEQGIVFRFGRLLPGHRATPATPTTATTAPLAAGIVLPNSPAALSQSNGDRS